MRGASETGEPHVRLADEGILKVDAEDLPDEPALAQAVTHPAIAQWTGIEIRHDEPAVHLDLWLATIPGDRGFGRLAVGSSARALGLADHALRWAGAGLYDGGTFAYPTARPAGDDANELDLIVHGLDSGKLIFQVNDLLQHRSQERPAQPFATACPASTPDDRLAAGARVIRPEARLTVGW